VGRVLLDTYVKPALPIVDYRTPWSGITAEKLERVTVTHAQAATAFLRIVSQVPTTSLTTAATATAGAYAWTPFVPLVTPALPSFPRTCL